MTGPPQYVRACVHGVCVRVCVHVCAWPLISFPAAFACGFPCMDLFNLFYEHLSQSLLIKRVSSHCFLEIPRQFHSNSVVTTTVGLQCQPSSSGLDREWCNIPMVGNPVLYVTGSEKTGHFTHSKFMDFLIINSPVSLDIALSPHNVSTL